MERPQFLNGYLFLIALLSVFDVAAEKPLNISAAYYLDQRGFNSITLQFGSYKLPAGFSLWGFTDLFAEQEDPDSRADIDGSFSEYRISYEKLGLKGLALQAEYNYFTPSNNDIGRFGIAYKKVYQLANRFQVFNQLRLFPLQTDGDGGQVSLIYKIKFSDQLIFSGFADYNIREQASNEWLFEPMLRYYFYNKIALALEYRFNGFEDANPALDGSAYALGVWVDL